MSNTTDDRYINLEKKVIEIDSKQKILEERYHCDLEKVYEILKKLESKLVGGGLDSNNLGLTVEMRDLKREMEEHTKQTVKIQATVDEIKLQLLPSQALIKDVAEIRTKLETHDAKLAVYDKYKWIVWGSLLTLGYLLNKISPFIEKLIP